MGRRIHRQRLAAVPADLPQLAALAGVSPHHLSRTFHRLTGSTVTGYRNRLRVRAVLEDLAAGATGLAGLAARYGFADQAHLTRTVRCHAGEAPAALRPRLRTDLQAGPPAARPGWDGPAPDPAG